MLRYLDWVAKIHTDTPEKKSKINVDYIHINALLGYVETTLVGGIHSLNLDRETELKALAAFNKLLWIQNDYFAKYYMRDRSAAKEVAAAASGCLSQQQWLCPAAAGAALGGLIAWYFAQRQ